MLNKILKSAFILSFLYLGRNELAAQHFEITNIRELKTTETFLTKPVWSPDNKKLLCTGQNNHGLYILHLADTSVEVLDKNVRIKSKPVWLKSGGVVIQKRNELQEYNQFKNAGANKGDTLIYLDIKKKKVIIQNRQNNSSTEITPDSGLYYNPILSPDGNFVLVHLGAEMLLFNSDGSGLIKKLGTGMGSCFTGDSRFLLFFIDESSDGHVISNSELYSVDINSLVRQKLTDTPERAEFWPAVSADGSKIAFTDDLNGKFFLADLILNEK